MRKRIYHINSLRVCRNFLSAKDIRDQLKSTRFLIIQHLLDDTAELIQILIESECSIDYFFAKPYSIDLNAKRKVEDFGVPIHVFEYDSIASSDFLTKVIKKSIKKASSNNEKLILLDVGGYFSDPLMQLTDDELALITGVVEDTTFGHTRYSQLVNDHEITTPILSVARSRLKEIEAHHVGNAVVNAIEKYLKEVGVSLVGKQALQIGFGMIGENVARALSAQNVRVSVYDQNDIQNLHAFMDGYSVNKKSDLLPYADLIVSATGTRAISIDDLYSMKSNVFLASAGSQDIEIPIKYLKDNATQTKLTDALSSYRIENGSSVILLCEGTAVNFGVNSIPREIMDLVFAEILYGAIQLVNGELKAGKIHASNPKILGRISKAWLGSLKNINQATTFRI